MIEGIFIHWLTAFGIAASGGELITGSFLEG